MQIDIYRQTYNMDTTMGILRWIHMYLDIIYNIFMNLFEFIHIFSSLKDSPSCRSKTGWLNVKEKRTRSQIPLVTEKTYSITQNVFQL